MTVEIKSVEIAQDKITIKGTDLEMFLFADDLFQEIEAKEVTFIFDRKKYNGAAMKYLYKIVNSQKICEGEKSFGKKLEALAKNGAICYISENFKS